ncbi:hypothetical protein [Acinetobacter sp. ANC 4639]
MTESAEKNLNHAQNSEGNFPSLMEDEDLFKVLKKRYHVKLSSVGVNQKIITGVFYETICMLENLENTLKKIHSGAYPTREEFSNPKSEQRQKEIIGFYQSLCVDKKILKYAQGIYSFSKDIQAFIKYLRKNENPFLKADGKAWAQNNFPANFVFDFVEKYVLFHEQVVKEGEDPIQISRLTEIETTQQDEKSGSADQPVKIDSKKNDIHELTPAIYKRFYDAVTDLKMLLDKHQQLYVLCLDIDFLPQEERVEKNPRALEERKLAIQNFMHDLDPRYGLIRTYSRLEIGINHRLNHHVILLFKVKKNSVIDPREIKAELEVIMENRMAVADDFLKSQKFDINIRIRDFKDVIASLDTKFPKTNIIKARATLARQKFEYWILGYFFLVDIHLKPDLSLIIDSPYIDQHYLDGLVVEDIDSEEIETEPPHRKVIDDRKSGRGGDPLEKLKAYDLDQSLEKVKNLPKTVAQELEQVVSLYSEYAQLFDWDKEHLKLLFLIEYFMRVIQHNHIEAFTCPHVSRDVIKNNPDKYLSYVAKLFVAIHQMMVKGISDRREIQVNSWVGWRVKEFFELYDSCRHIHTNLLINLDTYLKRFKIPFYNEIEKAESVKASKNSLEAKEYLKKMIKRDVFALRFEFSYVQAEHSTKQQALEAFHLILTDFLKNLKRTKKLSTAKLVAYLGTRFFQDNQLHADVTFIFDAQELLDDDLKSEKMIQEVEGKIAVSLGKYLLTKQEKMDVYDNKKAQTTQLRHAIQAIDKLKIQALSTDFPQPIKYHDKKALRAFIDKTISFYTTHALLCTWKPALESLIDPENKEKSKLLNMKQFLKGRIIEPQKKSREKLKPDQHVEPMEDLSSNHDMDNSTLADPHPEPQSQIDKAPKIILNRRKKRTYTLTMVN